MEGLLNAHEGGEKKTATTRRDYRERVENNQIIRGFEAAYQGRPMNDNGFRDGTELDGLFRSGYDAFRNFKRFGTLPDWAEEIKEKKPVCVNHSIKEVMELCQE